MLADEPPRAFFAAAMKRISHYHELMRESSRSPPREQRVSVVPTSRNTNVLQNKQTGDT